MPWFKKKKAASATDKSAATPTRAELIAQAKANMRGARERIGEEEIKRMAKTLFGEDGNETRH